MDAVAAAPSAAPAAPSFRVEYTPTADEFVEASLIPFRGRRIRNVVFTLACAPIIVFIGWIEHSNLTMCFAAVFALIAIFQPFLTRRLLRDYFRKHRQFGESSIATYWPQGLLIQTASVEMLVRWHAFTHFTESKRLFLLHRGPGNPAVSGEARLCRRGGARRVSAIAHALHRPHIAGTATWIPHRARRVAACAGAGAAPTVAVIVVSLHHRWGILADQEWPYPPGRLQDNNAMNVGDA